MRRFLGIAILWISLISACCASCTLTITSAGPCNANGIAGPVHLGDQYYGVLVNWNVTGNPTGAYNIAFTIGPNQYTVTGITTPYPGNYSEWVRWTMPVDGPIAYQVVLDPGQTSGDTGTTGHTASGSFTPIPPSSAFEWYGQQTVNASQSLNVTLNDPGVTALYVMFGIPTTETSQQVVTYTPNESAATVLSTPTGYPASVLTLTNPPAATYQNSQSFSTQAWNYMADQNKVDCNWSDLSNLPANISQYVAADSVCQSTDPSIQQFVSSVLPANYQTTLTPLQAARKLFQAVAAKLVYESVASADDAVTVLANQTGDCLGMSDLYVACVRSIGIPARTVCGWTTVENHCWTEIYTPTAGWIPQDVTYCNTGCKGAYAYYFMIMPDLNSRVMVSRGTNLNIDGYSLYSLQIGAFFYQGSSSWLWNTGNTISTGPACAMSSFYLAASSVVGGTGTRGVAQAGTKPGGTGMPLALSSNNSAVVVPATITIPGSTTGVSFPITTTQVPVATTVTITCSQGPIVLQQQLVVNPIPIANFYVNPTAISGGAGTRGVVQVSGKAGSGGVVVSLQSSGSSAQVPATVTVPQGSSGVSFAITSSPVSSAGNVTLTASVGGSNTTTTLTLNPYGLSNFYVSPNAITGGSTTRGVVQLLGKAGPTGNVVTLQSLDSHVVVPATVTVPAGSTGVSFAISTKQVQTADSAQITATFAGVTKQATITLSP